MSRPEATSGDEMYIIVDDRNIVTGGYASSFDREGVTTTGIDPIEFGEWLRKSQRERRRGGRSVPDRRLPGPRPFSSNLSANARRRRSCACASAPRSTIRWGCTPPGPTTSLRKPVHVREILARVGAISRRTPSPRTRDVAIGDLTVYFDGREVEIARRTAAAAAPRAPHPRMPGAQSRPPVVEDAKSSTPCTASSTRTSTKTWWRATSASCERSSNIRLGYDPIDSKRFLGYCLKRPGDED